MNASDFKDRFYAPPVKDKAAPIVEPVPAISETAEPPLVAAARAKAIAPVQPVSTAESSAILPPTLISMAALPPKPAEPMPVPIETLGAGSGFLVQIYRDGDEFSAEINFASDIQFKRQVRLRSDNLGQLRSQAMTFAHQGIIAADLEPPVPADSRYIRKSPVTQQQMEQEADIRRLLDQMGIEDK